MDSGRLGFKFNTWYLWYLDLPEPPVHLHNGTLEYKADDKASFPGLNEAMQSEAPFTGTSVSKEGASLLLNHSDLVCCPSEWAAPNTVFVYFFFKFRKVK